MSFEFKNENSELKLATRAAAWRARVVAWRQTSDNQPVQLFVKQVDFWVCLSNCNTSLIVSFTSILCNQNISYKHHILAKILHQKSLFLKDPIVCIRYAKNHYHLFSLKKYCKITNLPFFLN